MLAHGIKCICDRINVVKWLNDNRAYNWVKPYMLISGNRMPLIIQEKKENWAQIYLMLCLTHSRPSHWQMFLSYLLPHEKIKIPFEKQILLSDLYMQPLWNTLPEVRSVNPRSPRPFFVMRSSMGIHLDPLSLVSIFCQI